MVELRLGPWKFGSRLVRGGVALSGKSRRRKDSRPSRSSGGFSLGAAAATIVAVPGGAVERATSAAS